MKKPPLTEAQKIAKEFERTKLQRAFYDHWKLEHHGCPDTAFHPKPEYCFHPKREWKMDFAFEQARIFVEIQGGIYSNGRHTRGAALEKEYEKLNCAAELGWTPIFLGPTALNSRNIMETIALVRRIVLSRI